MPSTGPKNITEKMLRQALRKHAGVFVLAAQELGCDRSNITHRVNRSPKLQAFLAGIEEEVGDAAEAVIKRAILSPDVKRSDPMARWYADRKLSGRGYRSRQELTGEGGSPLPIGGGPDVHVHVTYVTPPSPGAQTEEEDVV